jgi:hypothetical protein
MSNRKCPFLLLGKGQSIVGSWNERMARLSCHRTSGFLNVKSKRAGKFNVQVET